MTTSARVIHIAHHRLLRLLGAGAAAEVHEVLTPEGERRALKLLKADLAPALAAKLQARLAQEGEALAMIEHVNVVRFHGAGLDRGRVWLLLELVDGPNLRALAAEHGGALPPLRALRLLRQAAEGVAAAHALGILHRDLKPENILVAEGDVAKVADFGSAKLEGWGVKTTREQAVGSSLYAAPEYMQRRVAGPESDVYALGLVLYELLTGAHPIAPRSATALQICQLQMSYTPPPLASLGRDLPGDLSDLVQQALAKDPARRPTMRAFADALAVVLRRLQVPQRALARGVALPGRELGLARTEPVRVVAELVASGAVGSFQGVVPSEEEADRSAVLPPAPLGDLGAPARPAAPLSLAGGAITLRSASVAAGARLSAGEGALGAGGARGSTTAPLERAASRPSRGARGGVLVGAMLGAVGTLLVVALLGGRWATLDAGRAAPAGAASGVSLPVVASGSASAAAVKAPPVRR